MSDSAAPAVPRRRSAPLLLAGIVLALLLGAGGFLAARAGLIPDYRTAAAGARPPAVAFVPVPTLVVSLGAAVQGRHLRFTAELEVAPQHAGEVARLMPRILDVLNGYLRALDPAAFEDRAALVRIRAQMLRRVQIVTGEGRVADLLVTEFVVN